MFEKIKGLAKELIKIHHSDFCINHAYQNLKWPLRSVESCVTCGHSICYICGLEHESKSCRMVYPTFFTTKKPVQDLANYELNIGQPMLFNLAEAACPCGVPLRQSSNSVICVACGNATCSERCHYKHVAMKQLCFYYLNFSPVLVEDLPSSFPSISLKVISKEIHAAAGAPVRKINRTSNTMLSCYIVPQSARGIVLLQRGHRQMGNPLPATLKHLRIHNSELDYHLFSQRICLCQCGYCSTAGDHNCQQCEQDCMDPAWVKFRESRNNMSASQRCLCKCPACASAKVAATHMRWQCCLHCQGVRPK